MRVRVGACVCMRAWGGGGLVVGQVTWPHVLFEFVYEFTN